VRRPGRGGPGLLHDRDAARGRDAATAAADVLEVLLLPPDPPWPPQDAARAVGPPAHPAPSPWPAQPALRDDGLPPELRLAHADGREHLEPAPGHD
ncbi:hypothetical protein DF186_14805, partial [Enterococcus hirae]